MTQATGATESGSPIRQRGGLASYATTTWTSQK